MKKSLFYLLATVKIFVTIFVSCNKDDNKDDIGGNPSIIEAKNVNTPSDIVSVSAYIYGSEDFEVASSKFQNNSFTLKLKNVPEELLGLVADYFPVRLLSDKYAKGDYLRVFADCHLVGDYTYGCGEFSLEDRRNEMYADYVFVDREFTIKGVDSDGYQYVCFLKKGWNIVYYLEIEEKITTQKPSNANFTWYYYN